MSDNEKLSREESDVIRNGQDVPKFKYLPKCYLPPPPRPWLDAGAKFDEGKVRYDLIPANALHEIARVYTYGANKYQDENWRKGLSWKRIFGALMRHSWAWMRGEDTDPESGLPHMAHAAFACFTLLEYALSQKQFDDRVM